MKYINVVLNKIKNIFKNSANERLKTVEHTTAHIDELVTKSIDERLKTVEHSTAHIDELVTKSIDERLKTVEWLSNQSRLESKFANQLLLTLYNELNQKYFDEYGDKIELHTNHPLAYGTDSIEPESTYEGTVRPMNFVRHCIDLLGKDIKCLDIGSGPGGLVYEWIFNDIKAIGIDGSDFCKKYNIGFWNKIPHSLFTCDITQPFCFYEKGQNIFIRFNVITMWEVLEHIPEEGLDTLFLNIRNHLNTDGYFIGSVSMLPYFSSTQKPYHITIKPFEWWQNRMMQCGIEMINDHPFSLKMFCRGVGNHIQDQHNYFENPNEGFHFVAKLRD